MAGNTYGKLFRLTSFGESHGKGIGGIIDGCPPGIEIDTDFIQHELDRRRPGQSKITTQRQEGDKVEILSGMFEGKTTGTPLAFIVWNKDQHSADYDNLKNVFRPSHADYTYQEKYGIKDHRGGGRSSARETIARVVAGAIAKLVLRKVGINITAYTAQVHHIKLEKPYYELDLANAEKNLIRCPDDETAQRMITFIDQIRAEGDTVGGVISCVATGVPVGLGEPVFDKLHAELGKAILSINAVKGFEYGSGFGSTAYRGSQHNDEFTVENNAVRTKSNLSGGVQGGISNGEDIYFSAAFKPVATIMRAQNTIDKDGNAITINPSGRHDPCVLPRAVPIVEAMAALVLVDFLLQQKTTIAI